MVELLSYTASDVTSGSSPWRVALGGAYLEMDEAFSLGFGGSYAMVLRNI